ncbi:DNA primase [Varibaculum cambriense]|uniref:DNA primase n=1 Tax=Varibaculum cambriense TaxID=184870 RepID=UPI00290FFC47|nr:DNA primase [Varibaculum cambriense]MDU3274905.1 DNA primase [Varibaculum cambriense]
MADRLQITFDNFVGALQAHLEAARVAEDPDCDPQVARAGEKLEAAFSAYDEALYSQLGCDLPLDIFEDEDIDSETLFDHVDQVLQTEESGYQDEDEDYDFDEDDEDDEDGDDLLDEPEEILDEEYDFDEDDEDDEDD